MTLKSELTSSSVKFFKGDDIDASIHSSTDTITLMGSSGLTCRLKGLASPDEENDATNKQHVAYTIKVAGENYTWKKPVRIAATGNVDIATLIDNSVVDGINVLIGDRILLPLQDDPKQNGIYVINSTGPPSRSSDFDSNISDIFGVTVVVEEGIKNSKLSYRCIAPSSSLIDQSDLPFSVIDGNNLKKPVDYAVYFNVDIATLKSGDFIQGSIIGDGSRLLLVGQTTKTDNGIYIVTNLTRRSADFSGGSSPIGMSVSVLKGNLANCKFICTNTTPGHKVGISPLEFVLENWKDTVKTPVRAVLTVNSNISDAGQLVENLVVDGVSLVPNDRLLIADIGIADLRGIWIIGKSGEAGIRSFDFRNPYINPIGTTVLVTEGSINAGVVFTCKDSTPFFGNNLKTSGSVTASNFLASSDIRLKTNFVNLQDSLDKIRHINGVKFDWKSSGLPDVGFLAQEVQEVFPEVVMTGEDGFLKVDYSRMIVLLLEAVKTMDKEMKTIDKEIRAIKDFMSTVVV